MNNHYEAMPAEFIDTQLALLQNQLTAPPYPNYPEKEQRLVLPRTLIGQTVLGETTLPADHNWIIACEKHSADCEQPTPTVTANLRDAGYTIDSLGRPLHPWFNRMASDPDIGVVGGKGTYFRWGPNHTADSVIVWQDKLLLIQRTDTGDWALPGGYVDINEPSHRAAVREAHEEAKIDLKDVWGNRFYKGPVVDPRMTAHAWPETSAYLFQLDSERPHPVVEADDDAKDARWVAIDQLDELKLFGSHRFLAALALGQLLVTRPAMA